MLVYYMVCILTHFWLSFVPKWSIFKLLGDYRYLSIMKPQIIDNSLIATLRSAISWKNLTKKKLTKKKCPKTFLEIFL
jgi:hypothetical protein